jgi:ubiquinone/menaquinone biosynthesis C-methylase UbiE
MNEHKSGQVSTDAAKVYEEFFVPALFAEWPNRVLAAARAQVGDAVLDVACGTGILARAATGVVGPQGTVVGVDINEGMLSVARQKAPHISWRAAPAEKLPFAAGTFDRVVSQFGLMFFADPTQSLAEMRRVLHPGGTVTVAVWGPLAETPGYAVMVEVINDLFGPAVAQSLQLPYSLGDKETFKALFKTAGLGNVRLQTLTGQARFSSLDAWIYTDIKGWTLAEVIDDAGYEQLRLVAQKRLSQFMLADGTVAFDTPAHIATADLAPDTS